MLAALFMFLLLFIIPVLAGSIMSNMYRGLKGVLFYWVMGHIVLWAGFFAIAVPLILGEKSFSLVVNLYSAYMVAVCVFALVKMIILKEFRYIFVPDTLKPVGKKKDKRTLFMWGVFIVLFLLQMLQCFRLAYGDGDDAFYVAVTTVTEASDRMYMTLPYTGGATGLSARYGMAPFPIWIAYLSRVTGISTATMALVALPPVLISITYAVYYLMGKKLFARDEGLIPVYMSFVALIVLYSDYSAYTPENFLLARSRQGKAAMGNIFIPMLLYLLFLLLERIHENKKTGIRIYVAFFCTQACMCLASTMGALLGCMLVGIVSLCAAVCYRRWKFLFPMAVTCLPGLCIAVMYVMWN